MSYMQLNVISLSHFVGWNQPCCIQADFDFHSWFVYECTRSSKWYQINFPKLLNFILDFLQESGERHLHHRPSSSFANQTWFWPVFLLQTLILKGCFITTTSRKFRSVKGKHQKLQERKENNENVFFDHSVSLSCLAWGWSMLGGTDGASKVPQSFGHEEANMEAQGWNRYEIDLWFTGLVSNQEKSIMKQSDCCAVVFAHLWLENRRTLEKNTTPSKNSPTNPFQFCFWWGSASKLSNLGYWSHRRVQSLGPTRMCCAQSWRLEEVFHGRTMSDINALKTNSGRWSLKFDFCSPKVARSTCPPSVLQRFLAQLFGFCSVSFCSFCTEDSQGNSPDLGWPKRTAMPLARHLSGRLPGGCVVWWPIHRNISDFTRNVKIGTYMYIPCLANIHER